MDPVITVHGLRKRYGAVEAVRGTRPRGQARRDLRLPGPERRGQETTVEILEGFRPRSDGNVTVLGVDPARADGAWRNRVGAVLQESEPEPGLTVRECLQLFAGYYDHPRDIDETIALVGLQEKADSLGPQLSAGQRRDGRTAARPAGSRSPLPDRVIGRRPRCRR